MEISSRFLRDGRVDVLVTVRSALLGQQISCHATLANGVINRDVKELMILWFRVFG